MIIVKKELSTRAMNVLNHAGVARWGRGYEATVDLDRLCEMTERDLIMFPGSGRKTRAEIKAWVEGKGRTMRSAG